ncbi:hypothetical protein D6D01_06668, partial [Aureobasidium pullulans]
SIVAPKDIDLSSPKYHSDGGGDQPPDDLLPHSKRASDDIFLTHLNEIYNLYVDKDQHLTSLPKGYTMYYCNLVIHGIRQNDEFRSTHIFGHLNGSYRCWHEFAVHVASIVKGDLENCACSLCVEREPPDLSGKTVEEVKIRKEELSV